MEEGFSSVVKQENIDLWNKTLNHPFFAEIGNFELPPKKFKTFVEQDYQYLLGFIKCLGLFLSKARQKQDIADFKQLIETNLEEMETLEFIYKKLGHSKIELESAETSLATNSYRSFLLSQGYEGSKFETYGAILPCDWIFAEIGKKLNEDIPKPSKEHHKIYQNWIENYASKTYQTSIKDFRKQVNEKAEKGGEKEIKRFRKNFKTGLKYEYFFVKSIYGQI